MKRPLPAHLRIVSSEARNSPASGRRMEPVQLEFPYPGRSTVFLVNIEALTVREFGELFGLFSPRWIIDVRSVPRMDKIAPSRNSAFSLFNNRNSSYVDLFGRLKIKSYRVVEANPSFWAPQLAALLEDAKAKGPYMFLFDNVPLLERSELILRDAFGEIVGKEGNYCKILSYNL
jgi:hypothetical protein